MDFDESGGSEKSESRKTFGLIALGVTGTVAVGLSVLAAPFVTPALRRFCLPYVPATSRQVENVTKMCKRHKDLDKGLESLIDLGSGDGRIVIAAAKSGFACVGVELNLWLVIYSKIAAALHGLQGRAKFQKKDLWKVNLSEYDKIVVFGVAEMMPTLKGKLLKELNGNSRVIACRFPIPDWKPIDSVEEGIDSVWVYGTQNQQNSVTN